MDGKGRVRAVYMDHTLHEAVRSFGLTGASSGYRYLVYALQLLREEPERLELVTKRIYPDVAHRFGVTVGTVEGALRRAAARGCPEKCGAVSVKAFLALLVERDRACGK